MRTLLYFSLNDTATARMAQVRFGDLAGASAGVKGPWFVQRDNQPVEEWVPRDGCLPCSSISPTRRTLRSR